MNILKRLFGQKALDQSNKTRLYEPNQSILTCSSCHAVSSPTVLILYRNANLQRQPTCTDCFRKQKELLKKNK